MSLLSFVQSRRSLIVVFALGVVVRGILLPCPINKAEWHECDLACVARNYFREDMNLSYPRIDWRQDGPGYAEMEFPAYPWAMAALYHVFGYHEIIGRLLSWAASVLALAAFMRLALDVLSPAGAFCAGLFFALAPLVVELSTVIQPEPWMLLGIVLAVLFYLRWLRDLGWGNFLAGAAATAAAVLAKAPAVHIGILFAALLFSYRGIGFLRDPRPWLFALAALAAPFLWYIHARNLWLTYGNSLGVSNEHHWAGWDLFTDPKFIWGLTSLETRLAWRYLGLLLGFIGALQVRTSPGARLGLMWYAAVLIYYLATIRTTGSDWAFYYHIASVPPAALLIGAAGDFAWRIGSQRKLLAAAIMVVFVSLYGIECYSIVKHIQRRQVPSDFYVDALALRPALTEPGLILASGGPSRGPDGYPVAINKPYFFYWLDRKGFNIARDGQSLELVQSFAARGARYFVAEKEDVDSNPAFAQELHRHYKLIAASGGVLIFLLDPAKKNQE